MTPCGIVLSRSVASALLPPTGGVSGNGGFCAMAMTCPLACSGRSSEWVAVRMSVSP